ncbi:MAG: C39 family peptidase [Pararhodobacter sp.]
MGKIRHFAAAILLMLGTINPASAQQRVLEGIVPVAQATHVWCWLAVGEMVFRYYGIPQVNFTPSPAAYQCGIVGSLAYSPPSVHPCTMDCGYCIVPAGDAQGMRRMLELYPVRAGRPVLETRYHPASLQMAGVVREIDAGHPVIIGISPSGQPPAFASEHVALIAGYDLATNRLLVHDPYPFGHSWANPYVPAGAQRVGALSYWVPLQALYGPLQWRETFTLSHRARTMPNHCCTAHGRFGPYENPVSTHPGTGLAVGETCLARTPYGNTLGTVCN